MMKKSGDVREWVREMAKVVQCYLLRVLGWPLVLVQEACVILAIILPTCHLTYPSIVFTLSKSNE